MSRWFVLFLAYVQDYNLITIYRLLNYTPPAVVIRLLTTNGLIAYISSWVLYLSGASSDPRLLLPAWISITTVQSFSHQTQDPREKRRKSITDIKAINPVKRPLHSSTTPPKTTPPSNAKQPPRSSSSPSLVSSACLLFSCSCT